MVAPPSDSLSASRPTVRGKPIRDVVLGVRVSYGDSRRPQDIKAAIEGLRLPVEMLRTDSGEVVSLAVRVNRIGEMRVEWPWGHSSLGDEFEALAFRDGLGQKEFKVVKDDPEVIDVHLFLWPAAEGVVLDAGIADLPRSRPSSLGANPSPRSSAAFDRPPPSR